MATDRPLTAKGLATRARIVAAAADLVFHRGAAQVALADVQAAADVSGSQLYHYFTDRDDLLRAVAVHRAAELVANQGPVDTLPALRAWVEANIALIAADNAAGGCRLGSLVPQLAETDPQTRATLSTAFHDWIAHLAAGLTTMTATGVLPPTADPHRLATLLVAALEGGILLAQAQRDITPMRTALEAALDHIASLATSP
ncbi:TetR/AcrR family transcriptional regulator [Actinokineospora bangkokensis]|uniref:HTH tetR-type domain-containing protein n=1 Tax=Actinokineospora bangkokensis TaxID=1193682 RepID=A0A1Q9LIH7_9PSEU|nr:TetR/AcrR family transcriptional regulator [Actinokineospora bangkokensis]OLR91826.1 hypothetical protein BJP25_23585 [Actinokineospora bangkokensis]